LAFRDDQLSPERRESVEARLGFYPEAARALADLRAWPEVELVPGMPEISDEEIDAGWQAFLSRLEELRGR
jgi:anti-sigma factor RsiW